MTSDRPDFTEASTTVGRDRIQLEAGYTMFLDRENGSTRRSESYPEALLRIGMFADWFEWRLGVNFAREQTKTKVPTAQPDGSTLFLDQTAHVNGMQDLYVGFKLALTEQKAYLPEMAIIFQATIPTGSDELSNKQVNPGFNYLYSWEVVEDLISIGGSLGYNRVLGDDRHYQYVLSHSWTVGYTLTENLGAYTEVFAFFPTSATSPDATPQYYFDGGFQYFFSDNLAFDIRAGVGLNRHADDFFVGAGFVYRR